MTIQVAVLIVAAGSGERAGGSIPKQYQMVAGKSLLEHSVSRFCSHPKVDTVQVVIHPDHLPYYQSIAALHDLPKPVPGGSTRQDSVRFGLAALSEQSPRFILIHDAARPFPSHALIDRILVALESHEAVIPVLPVNDTIKQISGNSVERTLDRSLLSMAQTPQGFHFAMISSLHQQFQNEPCTDDAMLAEKAGIIVATVAGEATLTKITYASDMEEVNRMMSGVVEHRVGMGFDTHRLIPHDPDSIKGKQSVILCGVHIPHDKKLEGHSDADVGYHALVDAMLGAIAAGDIGIHFPPTDPKWRGADSSRFVVHALGLLKEKSATIQNIDLTFICEKPHISNHRDAMIKNISHLLNLDPSRINIKATTTEKMGFTGRGEGIAAQAVVSVRIG
jgi:2-C-methyl-D-erythritol 4-phosphate cytidylyltransferase/2-C-methyl-D-erythritol 2,4-cyclodiphosphate synthase